MSDEDTALEPRRHIGGTRTPISHHPEHAGNRHRHPVPLAPVPPGKTLPDAEEDQEPSIAANARLTTATATVLLALLFAEGLTVLAVRPLLTAHVVVGMLLIPPVCVKVASTLWRFFRYYSKDPAYRRKGPPPLLLRLLGPLVVLTTFGILGSGVALLYAPSPDRSLLFHLHVAIFVVWFFATAVHVLGHLQETFHVGSRDWRPRTRAAVPGASHRQWVLAASLLLGIVLAVVAAPAAGHWLSSGGLLGP